MTFRSERLGEQIEEHLQRTRLAGLFLQSPAFMAVTGGPDHVFENARDFQIQYRIRTRDGDERWVREQGRGARSAADGSLAVEGCIFDITEQKEREGALRRSRALLRRYAAQRETAMETRSTDREARPWPASRDDRCHRVIAVVR